MSPFARRTALALVLPLASFAACTQDFEQFEPSGTGSPTGPGPTSSSSGVGGSGGGTGGSPANTSSSSVSSSVGVGGMGGAGGSGGGPLAEVDCYDDADNDNDGLLDCADPDCVPIVECVDDTPTGWEGPFRVNTTDHPGTEPALCPDGEKPETFHDSPGSTDCVACKCGGVAGASCSKPKISYWNNSNNCQGAPNDVSASLVDNACGNINVVGNSNQRSIKIEAPAQLIDKGSCPPSGGQLKEPKAWLHQNDLCSIPKGSGCSENKVCVQKGGGNYTGPVCVRKMGMDSCPAGWSKETVMYATVDEANDTRACTACTCTIKDVACTAGSYTLYDLNECKDGDPNLAITANCVQAGGLLDQNTASIFAKLPQPTGSCDVSGGEKMGSLTVDGPITVCCQ